nr:hypothetical protein CFP56_22237 [Quercus suber]
MRHLAVHHGGGAPATVDEHDREWSNRHMAIRSNIVRDEECQPRDPIYPHRGWPNHRLQQMTDLRSFFSLLSTGLDDLAGEAFNPGRLAADPARDTHSAFSACQFFLASESFARHPSY